MTRSCRIDIIIIAIVFWTSTSSSLFSWGFVQQQLPFNHHQQYIVQLSNPSRRRTTTTTTTTTTTNHRIGVVVDDEEEPDTGREKKSSIVEEQVGIPSSSSSRRDFFETATITGLSTSMLWNFLPTTTTTSTTALQPVAAWASVVDDNDNVIKQRPLFCIIGANGRTGTRCVQECLKRNLPVRATSRSGIYKDSILTEEGEPIVPANPLLSSIRCDVKDDPKIIQTVIAGSQAVIFAASASKSGGTSSQVDNIGVVNVAQACLMANIPHLIVISSGGVSQPNSVTYQFLNRAANHIMEEKMKGEDTVRTLYANYNNNNNKNNMDNTSPVLTYTIIRPGGLTEESSIGTVSNLELNQGDIKSGRISRMDVAKLCIEATLYPHYTGRTTFECYNANTGKSLNSVGLSNIFKQTITNDDGTSSTSTSSFTREGRIGNECRGDTFEELFQGLKRDDS